MAENIVINNAPPNTNSGGSSGLSALIRPLVILLTVAIIAGIIIALIVLVENWEQIAVFFTTGFIGWLNPFDSPDGDTGPVELVNKTATDAGIPEPAYIFSPFGWVVRYFSLK